MTIIEKRTLIISVDRVLSNSLAHENESSRWHRKLNFFLKGYLKQVFNIECEKKILLKI